MKMKNWFRSVRTLFSEFGEEQIGVYAAQSAFFVFVSFIPFLILLTCFLRYIPEVKQFVSDTIVNGIPTDGQFLVRQIINEVYGKTNAVMPITIIVALWSSGKGFQAITNGLNAIYQVEETRNYIYMRIRAVIYTLIFIIAIVIVLVLLVFGRIIQTALIQYWTFVEGITDFILSFSSLIAMLVLAFVFLGFYTFLPNKKRKLKRQLPGALITTVLWTGFSYGFSLYFNYCSDMSKMYGSLAAVMLVMLWLYFCMFLFFFGAKVNVWLEEENV